MDPNSQYNPGAQSPPTGGTTGSDPGYGAYGPQPAVASNQPYTIPAPIHNVVPRAQSVYNAPAPQITPQPMTTLDAYGHPQTAAVAPAGARPAVAPVTANPNTTQNTLQIAEIRDGIVIMNDGSFRSVIMVKSINFDLMSPQEREAVEYSYQGFLNSLYFPIQIFIRSQKVDIRPYLEKLDKIRAEHDNMLLALLMEDYIQFLAITAEQTNIMDKKFYVVIPYFPVADIQKAITQSKNFFSGLVDLFSNKEQHVIINEADLAKAKDELRNRIQATLAGLQQCGIQGLPLDTQEMIELYYDGYNPDTATRQPLKNFDDLASPIVVKGQGQAPQPNLERQLQ